MSEGISRRQFVTGAALTAAGAASVFTGSAFAAGSGSASGSAASGSASGSAAGSASASGSAASGSAAGSAAASGSAKGSASGSGSAAGSASGSGSGSGSGSAAGPGPMMGGLTQGEVTYVPSWLGDKPQIADSDITQTYDTEILIIGGGNAGNQAALHAAELGAKVMVMEKQAEDTYAPIGCDISSVNSQAYLDLGCEALDPMDVLNEWQRRTYDRSNPTLAKYWATRSGECVDHWRALVPQEELDEFSVYYGYPDGRDTLERNISGYTSFPGCISYRDFNNTLGGGENQPAWPYLTKTYIIPKAQEYGAQWLWGTAGTVLVQDADGNVTGAIGQDLDGNYVQVNASKAVLLACGDFSGNGDMVLDLNDEVRELAQAAGFDMSDTSKFTGMGWAGDGHKLAMWAGAVMEPGPRAGMNFGNGMGAPSLPSIGNYPVFGGDGKRFYNESMLQFGGQGFFARRPAGELICTIADGKWADNIKKQGYEHNMSSTTCEREWSLVVDSLNNYKTGPDGFPVYAFTGYGMNQSTMIAADTLDELADYLGYTGDAKQGLLDEVAHYNEMCAAGEDTDWGRDPQQLYTLDTPPFFGLASTQSKSRISSGMVQMSGVIINDTFQVLRNDDTVIGGLYAVGNNAGGRYAVQYHTLMAGNSVGIATCHGYVVGEILANL